MGSTSDLLASVRTATAAPSPQTVADALLTVGWPASSLNMDLGRDGIMIAQLGGSPKMLVASGSNLREASSGVKSINPLSMGYSSEAPYTLLWTPDEVQLHQTAFWALQPGDSPLLEEAHTSTASTANLLELLSPGSIVANDAQEFRGSRGRKQPDLAERLGLALADLRASIASDHADQLATYDLQVMRLFHQLLFIRFVEDRHPLLPVRRLEQVLEAGDPRAVLADIVAHYSTSLRSELFSRPALPIDAVPSGALRKTIEALTEPWKTLRLDFQLTPNDVSGRLYESYLGKRPAIIHEEGTLFDQVGSTDDRSQRGSFYTPTTVATELARATLTPWLQENRPTDPAQVRVLDPACGSGAFLLSSYRVLRAYFEDLRGRELDQSERRELLSKSIFGADQDESALMLAQVALYEEADLGADSSLPTMGENLLHGDSLVSPPGAVPYGGVPWKDVIATGGKFQVILANPPFGAQRTRADRASSTYRERLRAVYADTHSWGSDLAYNFVALAFRLLDDGGMCGFVLPRKVLTGSTASRIRDVMASRGVRSIHDYRGALLFPSVSAYVSLVTVGGAPSAAVPVEEVRDSRTSASLVLDRATKEFTTRRQTVSRDLLARSPSWSGFELRWAELRHEVEVETTELGAVPGVSVVSGLQSGNDSRFVIEPDSVTPNFVRVRGSRVPIKYCPHFVKAPQILPFRVAVGSQRIVLPLKPDSPEGRLVEPAITALGGRVKNTQIGSKLDVWLGPKILVRAFGIEPTAAVDESGTIVAPKGTAGAFAVALEGRPLTHLHGLAAYLNSALAQWWLRGAGEPKADESIEILEAPLKRLPVPVLTDAQWTSFGEAAVTVLLTLTLDDPRERVMQWSRARQELDDLVMDAMGVNPRLRSIVREEVIRRP
ncbi:N-6 DNA methylase [Cellulomonas phragmiteti]|uniref:site-specific DNA-methyltransferase (adenine-specific) n=1 Tax=Cellulomonas phragmiteti TaxID=478780 RepID=A0ABQ4DPN6_9CELL|nr:N-6 DNA methylase [Cellulomonas phragmiteti]GIG40957.1 hypothetical protein Cph01nite_27190 [Cellulomonas phragmiteti]